MTPLRQRMIQDLQLHGYAERTQESYISAVKSLSKYFNRRPDQLSQEDIRKYFLHLIEEKKAAKSTITIQLCGIKFFYQKTLGRRWNIFGLVRPKRRKKLPVVLSLPEIRQILEHIRNKVARTLLVTIYSCGLRLSEGTHLKVADIDGDRQLLRVDNGKGGKDRDVPIADRTLQLLRVHMQKHQHGMWLFPASRSERHFSNATLQKAFKSALRQSEVSKDASIHTLRHSYATHLLEHGVQLPVIQKLLGHRSQSTTIRYTHMTQGQVSTLKVVLNNVMDKL
jgi:integrase/recombinase XerD